MINRVASSITLLFLLIAPCLSAQDELPVNPNAELIKGTAFISYPNYWGSPWLSGNFLTGEIEFTDGTKVGNIGLRYSSYRDELIYYNTYLQAQIIIDKISLKGFSYTDENGVKRIFRYQHYNNLMGGDRYFEILSDGEISILAYRKVDLEAGDLANVKRGMEYHHSYYFYVYSANKGYSPININRKSLLSKFSPSKQKLVRRTLRKNRVLISDEASFVLAWNLLKDNGITIDF